MKTTRMTDRERARRIKRIIASLRTAKTRMRELDATVNTDDFKHYMARLDEIIGGSDEEGLRDLASIYATRDRKI